MKGICKVLLCLEKKNDECVDLGEADNKKKFKVCLDLVKNISQKCYDCCD